MYFVLVICVHLEVLAFAAPDASIVAKYTTWEQKFTTMVGNLLIVNTPVANIPGRGINVLLMGAQRQFEQIRGLKAAAWLYGKAERILIE